MHYQTYPGMAELCNYGIADVVDWVHIDGLMQKRHNSSALAMELRHSCTNPLVSVCIH